MSERLLYKRFDVRPLVRRGEEPLPHILKRVEALEEGQGLIVLAPFLPSPLVELLGSKGFGARIEHGSDGTWIVYFWRRND